MTVKTDKVTRLANRIRTLTDIIGRETTGEAERDAARRALVRLQAAEQATDKTAWKRAAQAGGYDRLPDGWYGAKYEPGRYMPSTELTAAIRADIKLARALGKKKPKPGEIRFADPIGDAPAEVRFCVSKADYSGGRSVDVKIKNVPAGWWTKEPVYGAGYDPVAVPGPALQELAVALADLANAYNYDRSDIQTDYFDTNFYLDVSADGHGESTYCRGINLHVARRDVRMRQRDNT